MIYEICASSLSCCNDNDKDQELLNLYPCLDEFGFTKGHITLSSLEDIVRLRELIGEPLIFGTENTFDSATRSWIPHHDRIEIYDEFRE